MHRNIPSLDHAEIVISDVRDAVAEYRWLGFKTVAALAELAKQCHVTPRRIRTLFHRDQSFVVGAAERRDLCLAIAETFDHLADEFERRADRNRDKADHIRHRENRQLEFGFGDGKWGRSGNAARRLAA